MVEHWGFIDFMRLAQPNFVMPGRKTIRNNCIKIFNTMKAQEIQRMAKTNRISLTTDLWTASDLTGYMVVTAHYITNKWNLVKKIIGFRLHTLDNLSLIASPRRYLIGMQWAR